PAPAAGHRAAGTLVDRRPQRRTEPDHPAAGHRTAGHRPARALGDLGTDQRAGDRVPAARSPARPGAAAGAPPAPAAAARAVADAPGVAAPAAAAATVAAAGARVPAGAAAAPGDHRA